MASYKKGTTIDMGPAAEEVNLNGTKNIYETMVDAQDSDNDDDDKVLINRGDILQKRRRAGYINLFIYSLLFLLCVVVLILSYFIYSLNADLKKVRGQVQADSGSTQGGYAKLSAELASRIGNLTKKLNKMSSDQTKKEETSKARLTKLAAEIEKVEGISSTVGKVNASLTSLSERASVWYPNYNAKFMGFGYPSNRSDYKQYHAYTLARCLATLHAKSVVDLAWNGMAFGHSQKDGWCILYKDAGRLTMHSKHYLYYVLDD